jgi:hypothetical protein
MYLPSWPIPIRQKFNLTSRDFPTQGSIQLRTRLFLPQSLPTSRRANIRRFTVAKSLKSQKSHSTTPALPFAGFLRFLLLLDLQYDHWLCRASPPSPYPSVAAVTPQPPPLSSSTPAGLLHDTPSLRTDIMAQIRGTAGYQLGGQNQFGGPSRDAPTEQSPLDAIREQTSKIEDLLDTYSGPVKPYVKSHSQSPHQHLVWSQEASEASIVGLAS